MSETIRGGRPRRPSMSDVAREAGVSHQTVSRVLNASPAVTDDKRARVQAAIDALGYRRNNAARALVTNRSGRIGVISAHLSLYGPSMIAASFQDAARDAGYEVTLAGVDTLAPETLDHAVEKLLDESVEAIVVAVAHQLAEVIVRKVDLPIPVILTQGVSAGQPAAAGVDQYGGAVLATEHLLDLGHTRIAHVTGPMDWVEVHQRGAGMTAALAARGLEVAVELRGDWSPSSGYQAGRKLARRPEITGVFVDDDSMALGVLRALHEQGRRVPDDVSVVGFDDIPEAAYFWPTLTTVRQDFARLGENAVQLVVRALRGEEAPGLDLVAPELVIRSSTAPPAD